MGRKSRHRPPRSDPRAASEREADGGAAHGPERLQKVLAAAGIGSRRDCEDLIREGRVEIDRQVVTELGTRVDPLKHEIRVDGQAIRQPKRLYFAVNKPEGVVTTNYDPSGRSRVIDLVPTEERVFAVGRLDRASEGLILVTNDGEFANRLTHPRYGVPKTYAVRVAGAPSQTELAKLRRGMHLSDGFFRIESLFVKGKHKGSTDMLIVLNEGKNREIRRMLARLGHKVLRLKRIAVGKLKLADLPVGAWRRLAPQEVEMLLMEAKERKRERRPKQAGAPKPVRGKRGPSPYREQQAAMGPPPGAIDLEDGFDGDGEDFPGGDEPMVEITDDTMAAGAEMPVGDVIDYEEAAPVSDKPRRPPRGRERRPGERGRREQRAGSSRQQRGQQQRGAQQRQERGRSERPKHGRPGAKAKRPFGGGHSGRGGRGKNRKGRR